MLSVFLSPALWVSLLVIVAAAVIQQRSTYLAGIISVMPFKVVAVMWIVWENTRDPLRLADATLGMVSGVVGTAVFLVVCWALLRAGWSFPFTLGTGFIVWAMVAFGPKLLGS